METTKRRPPAWTRGCSVGCWSAVVQVIAAILIIAGALYASSLTLEWVNLIGITSVPPGIKYTSYQKP